MNEEDNVQVIASHDLTDEMRIQLAIDKFYQTMEHFNQSKDHIKKVKLQRNNIVNMTDTYLKKFKNEIIIKSFYEKLKEAKNKAIKNGKINKYHQYMNEIRVIQEFKGIQENISDKLAEQLTNTWENSKEVVNWDPSNK